MSWAQGADVLARKLSYLPIGPADAEPAYAIADAWEPPHPLALDSDLCDRLVELANQVPPTGSPNGAYHLIDLADLDRRRILRAYSEANARWWRLDLDRWDLHVKHYGAGDRHVLHQDLHAGAAGRKLAGSVQLSEPATYAGGDLVMHFAGERIPMPRTRGTLIAFPGWTVHEVEPVISGERWALIVNGWGPPLR